MIHRRKFLQRLSQTAAALPVLATASFGPGGPAAAQPPTERKRKTAPARGPLRPHPDNPRYFSDGSGRAILLTGSHTWNNLVDMGPSDPPPCFDYPAYLDFMTKFGHNCFRLWTWESATWNTKTNIGSPGKVHRIAPLRYARTGPGDAVDGKPRFDLTRFDPEYFRRLRDRVKAAGEHGIYASIMLFEGWAMQFSGGAWEAHPYHPKNNVNHINGDPNGTGNGLEIFTLAHKDITALQEAYLRKVIDTVNDLDNVLYEVSNENHRDSTAWQYHVIRFVHAYEKTKPKQHPVGMTFQYKGGENKMLFDSPADWLSPNPEGGYKDDPPATDGNKIILNDTDHLWGTGGNAPWVWKSFLRGHHVLLMDPYDDSVLGKPSADWNPEPIRRALGDALRLARRINLAAMTPQNKLSSTKYCFAEAGNEYLVYLPSGGEATVDLSAAAGPFRVEWFNPETAKTSAGAAVAGAKKMALRAPFAGAAVLYVHK